MATKGTRVTPQEKEKMWRLYHDGFSFKKIAEKLRSITKRITNEGYIIFVFPIIIAQTYVRLSLEHYVPVDSNGEI